MFFFYLIVMRDLIRNYKMKIAGRADSGSDTESQPLISSASTSPCQSFGTLHQTVFTQDSDTETEIGPRPAEMTPIPPVLLQNKLNRKRLYPSSYETTELDGDENIYDNSYGSITRNENTRDDSVNRSYLRRTSFDYHNFDPPETDTHSSLVTIFAIWNTTVGTSLLAMSWGIEKTGLFPAIIINMAVAAICLYTSRLLLQINERHGVLGQKNEVSDLCKALLGKWAAIVAKIFSLIVLIGANIVYWILMSNFLYNSVHFFYGSILKLDDGTQSNSSVICPRNETAELTPSDVTTFDQIWDLYSTVPILLAVIMFPMLNWKSSTFFAKFNSFGTMSILYLIVFVATKATGWGVNMGDWEAEMRLKPTFCALTGMLSLSYFIHNIIINVMRNNRYQEHNDRDLSIAFGLITFTYLFIGVTFYVSFPLPKFCIEDNILNNFAKFDTMTIIARVLLLFQLFTVFPMISCMLRNDIFANINMIFRNHRYGDFTYKRVMVLNLGVLTVCILFACFMPRIGTLIRYTGALSGLVYVFMLPSWLKIASLRKERSLTPAQLIFHLSVMTLGVLNLISQFFISDK